MPRNARNQMHSDFNMRDQVSRRLSRILHHHFWQEVRSVKVIKCPPNSSPQGDINSNPNPNLQDKPNTNANPKVTKKVVYAWT